MSETITDFIKQDLKARLRAGGILPDKLTLTALSDLYEVSLTPIRSAVQELVNEDVLRKQPNGRMEVNPAAMDVIASAMAAQPASRPGALPDAEAVLAAEIIPLSLRGGDENFLREEVTAERLGIGRTVLRQLLNRLAGQGLIEHLPRRGWRVRRFDEAEMHSYLQVRESLELKALELARPHLEAADLQRMLHGNEPGTERLDNDLHRYLIDKAGNRFIREFFERHGRYYSALFDYAAPEANVVKAMARQHRAILRALLARDWRAARKALAQHIRAQRPIVRRLLRRVGQEVQP